MSSEDVTAAEIVPATVTAKANKYKLGGSVDRSAVPVICLYCLGVVSGVGAGGVVDEGGRASGVLDTCVYSPSYLASDYWHAPLAQAKA